MEIVKSIIVQTFTQFGWFVGVPVVFGLLLFYLARMSQSNYIRTVGPQFNMYFTGWIGTPVHEFGHWIFCLIFRHKIKEVCFFKPDKQNGILGYVNHSYDSKSIYQNVGNFFIGMGPIFVGTSVLAALSYFLLPNAASLANEFDDFVSGWPIEVSYGWKVALKSTLENTMHISKVLFQDLDLLSIQVWIFAFISICVSSHMALSISDIKTAWMGMLAVIALLMLLNVSSALISHVYGGSEDITLSNRMLLWSLKFGGTLIFLLTFSLLMSIVNYLFSLGVTIIFTIFNKRK